MGLHVDLEQHILSVVKAMAGEGADLPFNSIVLEQPKDLSHGDLATNAAMVLARPLKQNPRALAENLVPEILKHESVENAEIAGPGFINIKIKSESWGSEMLSLIENSKNYTSPNVGNGEKVLVEFVSINPTGPIHVGHGRNAVLGDSLCRLLEKTNHKVYREYLINDDGNQILGLVFSVHARYLELFGKPLKLPEDGYVGEYIIDIAQSLKDRDGDKWLEETDHDILFENLRAFCVDACMSAIKADMNTMGVKFDRFHSEYEMHQSGDPLSSAVKVLKEKGVVFEGIMPPPKGKVVEDYDSTPLTLFKATDFGAEQDKPVYNRKGKATYFGQDIAYHQDKLTRNGGQDRLITVIAAQQQGNFTPLLWALESLTGRKNSLHPLYYSLVKAMRDGEPIKLSKRAGNIVALKDVLAEVGTDAYRFHMLTRTPEKELIFDLSKAVEKSMDNPVFYVQYAHARACAVFRQQEEMGIPKLDIENIDLSFFSGKAMKQVLLHILFYPQMLERASVAMEPHRLAFYAMDLAASFHSWYTEEKFLDVEDVPATHARLVVVRAVQLVLEDLLGIIGISAPKQM